MENSIRVEKNNRPVGIIVAVLFHAALVFILLYFYLKPPDPPITVSELGGGGVELNYGVEDAGTGDPTNLDDVSPNPENANEVPSSTPENPEETPEEKTNPEDGLDVNTDEREDPDKVEVKTTEKKPENKTDNKTDNKNTNTTNTKVDNNAILNKKDGKSGPDKNNPNDPGKLDGTLDGNALLGKKGKGGNGDTEGVGPAIGGGLAGWTFVKEPKVDDKTAEKGTLTFRIIVNEDGIIEKVDVTKNEGGISPTLILKYAKALEGQELSSTTGATLTSTTQGSVVWKIKAK